MIKQLFLVTTTSILLILSSCDSNPLTPPELVPGRRDYVWSVDTIHSCNPIHRLWGSSPSNVYAITGLCFDVIFRFDGYRWASSSKYQIPYSPYAIYGFACNIVYIGAASGRIYFFDGNEFREVIALTKDGHSDIAFNDIWGESPNNFFAFGAYPDKDLLFNNSVIAHYNNNQWTLLDTGYLKGIVAQLFKNKTDQLIYLQVIKYSNTYDSTFIYRYNQGQYSKLYGTMWDKYWASISLINNEVYFVLDSEIARMVNNKFQTVIKLGNTNFYERLWGRNSKDIFLEMTDGLAHYDGSDIQYLFYFNKQPRTQIWSATLFNNDVFFLVSEGQTGLSLIYHGKLR